MALLPDLDGDRNVIRDAWDRLSGIPGGRRVFHALVSAMVPYTGSLGARVISLEPGRSEIELVERWAVRNHLRSIHAVALANLAEFSGNLAVAYAMADDARFIVAGMDMVYHKKARGRVVARTEVEVPTTSERIAIDVPVRITDEAGDRVCEATLHTLIGPKPRR